MESSRQDASDSVIFKCIGTTLIFDISTRSDQNIITHLEQNVQEEQNKNLNPIDCNVKYFIARAVSLQVRNIGLRFLAWSQSPTM